ncbi:MAG TPA: GNAT family N-acetyltransferase [Fimbriimonas sp.]|nr:GNAT family N-acetyltransferase [Fimbriimonas sp.]
MTNDSLREIGTLALGSRLRRLSDQLMGDVAQNYATAGVEFKPAWFPVLHELYVTGPSRPGDIAARVGISHVAINRTTNELEAAGLIQSKKDDLDARARLIELTQAGNQRVQQAQEVWDPSREAMEEILAESAPDFVEMIGRVEDAIQKRSLYQRFADKWHDVQIVPFNPIYANKFGELNRVWIEEHFQIEPRDEAVFEDPEASIIKSGGEIYFAIHTRTAQAVGTVALQSKDGNHQLAKLAVDPAFQGHGIGRLLCQAVIDEAQRRGVKQLTLQTNSVLAPAIKLYETLGFQRRPVPTGDAFSRTDTYMVLELSFGD